jgi:ribose transport system ATP-binding protein
MITPGADLKVYVATRLTAAGVAIVLITDELLELIGMSNRIAVMQHGKVTAMVNAAADAKPTEVELIGLMLPGGNTTIETSAA